MSNSALLITSFHEWKTCAGRKYCWLPGRLCGVRIREYGCIIGATTAYSSWFRLGCLWNREMIMS